MLPGVHPFFALGGRGAARLISTTQSLTPVSSIGTVPVGAGTFNVGDMRVLRYFAPNGPPAGLPFTVIAMGNVGIAWRIMTADDASINVTFPSATPVARDFWRGPLSIGPARTTFNAPSVVGANNMPGFDPAPGALAFFWASTVGGGSASAISPWTSLGASAAGTFLSDAGYALRGQYIPGSDIPIMRNTTDNMQAAAYELLAF